MTELEADIFYNLDTRTCAHTQQGVSGCVITDNTSEQEARLSSDALQGCGLEASPALLMGESLLLSSAADCLWA